MAFVKIPWTRGNGLFFTLLVFAGVKVGDLADELLDVVELVVDGSEAYISYKLYETHRFKEMNLINKEVAQQKTC